MPSNRSTNPPRTNWAGNLTYGTDRLHLPQTIGEAQEIVKRCGRIKALGSRHCFNTIADNTENQLSLQHLNRVVHLDEIRHQVTVEAGIRYGDLCPYLHERGYALPNLASLPHISIVGACATATHGSGVTNGNLATAIAALAFIDASGEVITLSRDTNASFAGAVVSLGGLGVVTQVTLDLQPTFDMAQHVYLDLPLTTVDNHFEAIMAAGYSVSLFTDWQCDTVNQVWIKRKVASDTEEAAPTFYGARLATNNVHPIGKLSAVHCTEQRGVPGPWYERLPHFRMAFTPSSGTELQSEYFVPRAYARDAIRVLRQMGDQFAPLLMISEIRTIDADDLWMSPCYQQPSVAFHFTWKQDEDALNKLLPILEQKLAPFEARPHWGKVFTMSPGEVQAHYDKLPAFRDLLQAYDPNGKFRNAFLQTYLFGG